MTGIYDQRQFTYIGEEDHFLWEEYGIELLFPSCDSEVYIEGTVSVLSFDVSTYKFPKGYELVSAVYDIKANKTFPRPLTVKLQHSVPIHDEKEAKLMSFVKASSEQGPPYTFEPIGGDFHCESSYGLIELNHFSQLATVLWYDFWWYLGYPEVFRGCIYCPNQFSTFVVTRNLPANKKVRFTYATVELLVMQFSHSGSQRPLQN